MFDLVVDRDELLKMSDEEVHTFLSDKFPHYRLFDHSLDWRKDERYILKAKGGRGDVIVGWSKKGGK